MKKLQIQTSRLLIRHLELRDLDDFYTYRSNPEVTKYQGFGVIDKVQSEAFIIGNSCKYFGIPGEWVQFAIEEKSSGRLVGDCAIKLSNDDIRLGEIGITISHTAQRNGYGKEALKGIVDFLFSIEGFHRVTETTDLENIAAIKLLESLGFRKEGQFIENIFFKGKWGSELQYAMLKKDWERG